MSNRTKVAVLDDCGVLWPASMVTFFSLAELMHELPP